MERKLNSGFVVVIVRIKTETNTDKRNKNDTDNQYYLIRGKKTMGFDIKLVFPKTPPIPKDKVLQRVAEVKKNLSLWPKWLSRNAPQQTLVGYIYPTKYQGIPFEFTRAYYEKGPHNYATEARKSSKVELLPFFFLPKKETGISPFQLFSKRKGRIDLKQIWEYLMIDLWSHLLRYYSQCLQITLKAPVAVKLEDDALLMSFNSGSIGDLLHKDFEPNLQVTLPFGRFTLYQAFAFHLGALAHIKEAEELKHGDYQLKHILFDPGNLLDPFFYAVYMENIFLRKPTLVNPFLTTPSLSVTDIEHGLRAPRTLVQEENENLLKKARIYAASQGGLKIRHFEKAYRDGYDTIRPENIVQKIVDWQYERWGFSVDTLF